MAKTQKGKKIVPVKPHKRKAPGGKQEKINVDGHRRLTPN